MLYTISSEPEVGFAGRSRRWTLAWPRRSLRPWWIAARTRNLRGIVFQMICLINAVPVLKMC